MRSGVINKKNKIGLADVESMALVLSKSTKTVTQLKQVFPSLEANLRGSSAFQASTSSSSKSKPAAVLLTEDFLKRTPERLENVWKRCKKLTGTLVTLKRLASVQEQRFHPGSSVIVDVNASLSPTPPIEMGRINNAGDAIGGSSSNQSSIRSSMSSNSSSSLASSGTTSSSNHHLVGDRKITDPKEGTLDDLLDALQNYSNPNKNVTSGNKKLAEGKQCNNVPLSISKLTSGISIDKKPASSSPQKRNSPLPNVGKSVPKNNIGSNFEDKVVSENNKPPPCPPPRGPVSLTSNGPIQNTTSSPSSKTSAGSSTTSKMAPPPPPPRTSSTHPVSSNTGPVPHGTNVTTDSTNNGVPVYGIVRKMSSKINSLTSNGKESGGESSDFRYLHS